MRLQTTAISASIAIFVGIAQCYFLLLCWGYIGAYSPLVHWLLGLGLRGLAIRATVFPIDFLTSVIISLPAAFVLLKLRPRKMWIYLLLAVIPGVVWHNWDLVGNSLVTQFAGSFALGWLPQLFALPAAAWILRFISRPGSPNKSFEADGFAAAQFRR
jgi:hypothetical protein